MVRLREAWVLGPRGTTRCGPPKGPKQRAGCEVLRVTPRSPFPTQRVRMGGGLSVSLLHVNTLEGRTSACTLCSLRKCLPGPWRLEGAPAEGRFVS